MRWLLLASVLVAAVTAGIAPSAGAAVPPGAAPETVAPETVIGTDGRTPFTATTTFPSSAIGKITTTFDSQNFGCTGFLIAPDFILTAAHCVFFDDLEHGGDGIREEPEAFVFTAGRNGTETPFGVCHGVDFFYTQLWATTRAPQQDFAGVQLDCDVGDVAGMFHIAADNDRDAFTGLAANLRGYPVEPPSGPSATAWTMKDRIEGSQKKMLFYDIDSSGGQSGGPIYNFQNPPGEPPAGWYVMAVHAYGVGISPSPCTCNAGVRLNPARVGLIQEWMGP